jgi:hypothetical protein
MPLPQTMSRNRPLQTQLMQEIEGLSPVLMNRTIDYVRRLKKRAGKPRPARIHVAASVQQRWKNPLLGLCRDSSLTVERFEEMQREDKQLEIEADKRLWGK